ncbi:MAG: LytTR family transcriptional regulator [Clostridia bacterium]|nr:LytTR family transcriptional regulator [Clostridia bacterium]
MSFKVKIEIDENYEPEIVIKCRALTDEVSKLQSMLTNLKSDEIELTSGDEVYFIAVNEILFFESYGSKTAAHTKTRMYYSDLKLYEISEQMPTYFMRISKSCIVNTKAISSIRREITGVCEAFFSDTPKKVYISRSYYKAFREKINETRLK